VNRSSSPSSDTTWQDEDQVVTASYLWVHRETHRRYNHGWKGVLSEAQDLERANSRSFIAGLSTTSNSLSWGGHGQMWLVVRSHGGNTTSPTPDGREVFLCELVSGDLRTLRELYKYSGAREVCCLLRREQMSILENKKHGLPKVIRADEDAFEFFYL